MTGPAERPKHRSPLRAKAGALYYGTLRRLLWLKMAPTFAKERRAEDMPYEHFAHATPLLRRLRDVDMALQHNKVENLKLAVKRLDGVVIRPGETFSYWYLIGKPSRRKGYREGMVLRNGKVTSGVGGGLCQLSNLIYWMALHTPLTVTERHRHGYDVFPDSGRTQPFGSGATCAYPYGDLTLRNDTDETFQLRLRVGPENLEGAFLGDQPPVFRYEIVERDHEMRGEFWGGYTRRNKLFRLVCDLDGKPLYEEQVAENQAVMMYSPLLEEAK
ncbi:VanW family protein [Pseudoflavonifractor phocaeensis]|uniref:VanW family protein n=1 Tax=Pseudoflavonifractor phocaeensis TaxID=1870988 RepID=UPI00313BC260